jgi:tetratricopeptide (TPR) repeat protein
MALPPPPQSNILWQLQIEMGRVIGPLSTEQLLFRIREGLVTGQEKIRRYPNGPWVSVSREPIFYDELLSALEKTQSYENDNGDQPSQLKSFTKTTPPEADPDATAIRRGQQPPPADDNDFTSPTLQSEPGDEDSSAPKSSVSRPKSVSGPQGLEDFNGKNSELNFSEIEARGLLMQKMNRNGPDNLVELKKKGTSQSHLPAETGSSQMGPPTPPTNFTRGVGGMEMRAPKKIPPKGNPLRFLAFALIVGAAGVGYVLYGESSRKSAIDQESFGLISPKITVKTKLSESEQIKREREIFALLFQDTAEDYFKAQVLSARVIEGAPNLSDPRGLLCISHFHLWPYVAQNSTDFETVQAGRRAARMLDPRGLDGLHCEVAYLMMMGKYKEALGIIDHTAALREVPESPVLYSMKAEILAAEKKFQEAALWAAQAQTLWPNWLYPYYQQGLYLEETAQFEQAIKVFQGILTANANHRASVIELGSLMFSQMQRPDQAEAMLLKGAAMPGRILKSQEAKANFILAQLMQAKNNIPKALLFAERAFQMNSGDLHVRDLLIKLGGNPNAIIANRKANELVFIGDQYFRSGDYLFAQAQYKTAFEQEPTNALAASKAAKCLWLLSQSQDAISWARRAIKADPMMALAYFQAADYLSQQYNFQAAGEVLNMGVQKLPNNAEILRGFGLVEIRRNNARDAIAYLERAFKVFDNDEETLVLLAQAYAMSGNGDDAQKALTIATRAIQVEDTNPEAQVIYAKTLAMLKGVDAGIDYMKELVAKYSYSPEFRMGLAELYRTAERYSQAQIEYERLVLMDANDKKAALGLGESYQAQGILDKALKKYLSAAVLDPSDPEPLIKAGLVYHEAGRYPEAISQFQRGLAVSPSFPKANYYIGRARLDSKDFKGAIAAAEAEKKINPQLADPYILEGEVYLQARDYNRCANEFQQAVRYRPKGAANYTKLALCQELAGNLEIAEAMLAIALSQESGYAEIYKIQGNISERKGENQAAIQAYQKYLVLAPNAVDRREVESRLERMGAPVGP